MAIGEGREEKKRTKSVSIHKVSNKSDQRMGGKSAAGEKGRVQAHFDSRPSSHHNHQALRRRNLLRLAEF